MGEITNKKILVLEDDEKLLGEVSTFFRSKNNEVFTASSLSEGIQIFKEEMGFDVVILDLILPDGMGLDFFDATKNEPPVPVVILTSLTSDDDILSGISSGAVDYISKPCSLSVLEAKISIRLLPKEEARVFMRGLSVDANLRTVFYHGNQIPLTSTEFNILFFLIKHSGTFFTSDEIYEKVWHAESLQTKTVRKHISTLRQKLKDADPKNTFILTDFGRGYCFAKEDEEKRKLK